MARMKKESRQALLVAIFVSIMSVSGGLLGAIAGVVLALLSHTVLNISVGTMPILAVSLALGALGAAMLSVVMLAQHNSPRLKLVSTRLTTATRPEGH